MALHLVHLQSCVSNWQIATAALSELSLSRRRRRAVADGVPAAAPGPRGGADRLGGGGESLSRVVALCSVAISIATC